MNPLYGYLNDRLERECLDARSWSEEELQDWRRSAVHAANGARDPEVDGLVALARRLQAAPALQVDPDFARRLERRILAGNTELRRRRTAPGWVSPRSLWMHPVFGVAAVFCLLVLLLGTGVLVVAAQVSNPNSPLYVVRQWEQHVRISLAGSPADQAEQDLQNARDRLNTLADLADPAHAESYRQALVDLDQQISNATQAINALPAGPDRDRLSSELATLKTDARHILRRLLSPLAWSERLVTTHELGRLGSTVPSLQSVEITLPEHPNGQATVSITGDNLQPGAQLLVDGRLVEASGSLQNSLYVFVANWTGNQHPQSIGILNPDGTAAQTTAITLKTSGGSGRGNGNGGGKENGNGGGKSNSAPPPQH